MLTGAGGGIARVLADALHDAGARLVLVGRGPGPEREAERLGVRDAVRADLTRAEDAARLRAFEVDALVHTVGGFAMQKAEESSLEDAWQLMRVNFDSLFLTVQAVLPGMLARQRGVLVGVSAGQAARGAGAGAALYTASKAAVAAYLKSLDAELHERGVRATVVYPMGAVDTPANRAAGMKPERMIDPRELAASVLHVLARSSRGHLDEVRVHP